MEKTASNQRKQSVPMQNESAYRIRNWGEHNRALIQRGRTTVWIDEKSIKNWFSSYHTYRPGRPALYSDKAILMMLQDVWRRIKSAFNGNAGDRSDF